MKLNLTSKILFSFVFIFIISNCALACEFDLNDVPKTSNMFSPELIWGLFIILLHMVMGLVHTWFREKKTKKE